MKDRSEVWGASSVIHPPDYQGTRARTHTQVACTGAMCAHTMASEADRVCTFHAGSESKLAMSRLLTSILNLLLRSGHLQNVAIYKGMVRIEWT